MFVLRSTQNINTLCDQNLEFIKAKAHGTCSNHQALNSSRCQACQNHVQTVKNTVFPVPVFKKLTNAGQHYMQMPRPEFHPNRTVNVENTGRNYFTVQMDVSLYPVDISPCPMLSAIVFTTVSTPVRSINLQTPPPKISLQRSKQMATATHFP